MGRWGRSWCWSSCAWSVPQDKEPWLSDCLRRRRGDRLTAMFIVPGVFTGYWQAFTGDQGVLESPACCCLFYLVQYFVIEVLHERGAGQARRLRRRAANRR